MSMIPPTAWRTARAELPFGVMCAGPTARSHPQICVACAGLVAGGVAAFCVLEERRVSGSVQGVDYMEHGFDGRDDGGTPGSARQELARLLQAARDDGFGGLFVYRSKAVSRVCLIFELARQGRSLARIAARLNEMDISTEGSRS